MKKSLSRILAVAVAGLMLSAGCALRKGPPDAAKIQQKIQATADGERELIRAAVADSERAENLVGLLAERDRLVAEQAERITAYRELMLALNADHGAERASFEEAVASYNAGRREWQREVAELVDAMKAEATAEEWKAIAKYQVKKMNPRELAYDSPGGGS